MNGVDLSYIEQGTGAPVVFVHGAFSDSRFWEPQWEAVAGQYRFIAYDYRYHGTAPWPDDGEHYSAATHAADLAAFIRGLNAGGALLADIPAKAGDAVQAARLMFEWVSNQGALDRQP